MKTYRIIERLKQLRNLIWAVLPGPLQRRISQKAENAKMAKEVQVYLDTKVSEEEVRLAFNQLHFTGDVKIHSSLVEIGNIHGKYKSIVQCLQEKVLDQGHTILAIAIPIKGSTLDYLRSITTFDKSAPIAMGALSKYYASLPGALRSLEPTHSVVAYGPQAEYYTSDHHLDETPFGERSPYYKLLLQNGQILMVGADIKHLTLCHLVEDLLGDDYPISVYDRHSFPIDILNDSQCIHHGHYKAHSRLSGILRVPQYILSKILELPRTQIIPLGASRVILLNVRDVIICVLNELKKGNSIYGHVYIKKNVSKIIDEKINWIKNL